MKIILSLLLSLLFSVNLFAQPWMKDLDRNANFYEIQEAFNKHWEGKTPGKGQGWKPFKRWEHYWRDRIEPNGDFPNPTVLWNAWQQKKLNFGNGKGTNQINTANWTEMGPLGNVFYPNGDSHGAGRVDCIAVDPNDYNTIWVGTPSGGLWKTTNNGQNWTTMTDDFPTLGISWILIDPNDTNIMYIGTGDRDHGATIGIGVLKSIDGGNTWNTTGLSYNIQNYKKIYELVFDPTNSNTIFAVTSGGILKSTDAAATWTTKESGTFKDIEFDPNNTTTWYAAKQGSGIYKSTDNGETWNLVFSGFNGVNYGRIAVDVTGATNPSIVYSLFANPDDMTLFKSVSNGTTWTLVDSAVTSSSQAWYDLHLGVSPTDENIVLVGVIENFRSVDGGSTWTLNNQLINNFQSNVHVDNHTVVWVDSSTVLIGSDGGVYKSVNAGVSYENINGDIAIRQLYRIGVSKMTPEMVLAGAQDNGNAKVENGVWTNISGADGMECAVDPTDPNIIYFSFQLGYFKKSTDAGTTHVAINNGINEDSPWVTPFIINPYNTNELFRTTNRVYKSTDQGANWFPISDNFGIGRLTSLALANSNQDVIYTANFHTILKTLDGGNSWTDISSNLPLHSITYIAVHPTDENIVWVTMSGFTSSSGEKVFKTTNGGLSWTNISGNLPDMPVNCIAVDPVFPNQVYIGTDLGIFLSTTGGGNWQDFSNGLPNVVVNEIEIHYPSGKIRAATYGRGLWESNLESFSNSAGIILTNDVTLSLQPNGFANKNISLINGTLGAALSYNSTLINSPTWASISPQNGLLVGITNEILTLSLDATNLTNGNYNTTLELTTSDQTNPVINIPVNLTVDPNAGNSPNPPTNLFLLATSTSDIYTFWADQSNDELGFIIERSKNENSGFTVVDSVDANITTFVDTNLEVATKYFYRVTAYNATGNSHYTNTLSATTLDDVPQAPTNLIGDTPNSLQVKLSWTDNSDNETNFVIERKVDNIWSSFTEIGSVEANKLTFSDNNLVEGVSYIYRVKAINSIGSSVYSNQITVVPIDNTTTLPINEGFENSPLGEWWKFETSSTFGQIQVTNTLGLPTHSGNYHLTMDISENLKVSTNSATVEINPENNSNLILSFWWKDFGDENNIEDGIFISNDGENYVLALQLLPESYSGWTEFTVDLSQVANSVGMTISHPFFVRFQQRDNFPISDGDGIAFDDISITSSELLSPQVTLNLVGNDIQLNWNSVLGANFYKIYKSIGNPNFSVNNSNLLGITSTLNFTDQNAFSSENKIFYIVTANTDSTSVPISTSEKLEIQK
ncbi:MAG: hypothetical protein DWQ06_12320 [Calditrichaeota bacterium]|nr:MAG: hypothetical protein DWQ06_12320 [Calditrichota bacterium]